MRLHTLIKQLARISFVHPESLTILTVSTLIKQLARIFDQTVSPDQFLVHPESLTHFVHPESLTILTVSTL